MLVRSFHVVASIAGRVDARFLKKQPSVAVNLLDFEREREPERVTLVGALLT